RILVKAWLVAGALDILAAIVFWAFRDVAPLSILQSVASGLLGNAAYEGGWLTGVLGLSLHFAIMFVIAALYVAAVPVLPRLASHWLVTGAVFGVVVYFVMNAVVLPLSAFPQPFVLSAERVLPPLLIQVACVGWPIAFLARPRAAGAGA